MNQASVLLGQRPLAAVEGARVQRPLDVPQRTRIGTVNIAPGGRRPRGPCACFSCRRQTACSRRKDALRTLAGRVGSLMRKTGVGFQGIALRGR